MIRRYLNYISFIILISSVSFVYSDGNENDFELGTAMYRDLWQLLGGVWNNHWHTAVFSYFTYCYGTGYLKYVEAGGIGDDVSWRHDEKPISVSNYLNDIGNLKSEMKDYFSDGTWIDDYNGAFTRNDLYPYKREAIVATSRDDDLLGISYTWVDMLDVVNEWCWVHYWWCEHWDGTIAKIDEIRCDGVIEYSYEKNGYMVSNYNDISAAGQSHVDMHNNLHDGDYNHWELCPKLQSGEGHFGGGGTTVSLFDPLISAPPDVDNFTSQDYNEYVQLRFRISDNASMKSYILIQVKRSSENDWHVLIDNNNTWKFKEVNLTTQGGQSYQYDYFHLPWSGKYQGGHYNPGVDNFVTKIAVIDQGANIYEDFFSFTASLPQVHVNISGPTSLGYN